MNIESLTKIMDLLYPGNDYKLPTLYMRDNRGKFKVWDIRVVEAVNSATIIVEWGMLGGKRQVKNTTIVEGKNIGRSNETTFKEQAILEAQAEWEKKRTRGGYHSLEDIGVTKEPVGYSREGDDKVYYKLAEILKFLPDSGTTFEDFTKPMLAQKFYKKLAKGLVCAATFPAIAQPKINGVRCIAYMREGRVLLMSRQGTEYRVDHVAHNLAAWYNDHPEMKEVIFDGELFVPGSTAPEIAGACASPNLLTGMIKYNIFDLAITGMIQTDRFRAMKQMDLDNDILYPELVRIKNVLIYNEDEARDWRDKFIKKGYEGLILRDPNGMYQPGKRSKHLVKYKRTESAEFMVLDVIDTRDNPELAMLVCRNDKNHETFEVVPQGTHEFRRELFKNPEQVIGKMYTVEFYERTAKPKEVPFHGTGIGIRENH